MFNEGGIFVIAGFVETQANMGKTDLAQCTTKCGLCELFYMQRAFIIKRSFMVNFVIYFDSFVVYILISIN